MRNKFVIADVFTETAFGGNQLAVFPDAVGISDADMQAYAREINFMESTFVLPARTENSDYRVRIFSPTTELPFAGHPTVGTAAVLRAIGAIKPGTASVVFEENIGPVTVAFEPDRGPTFARLILGGKIDKPASAPDPAAAAAALSLADEDILDTWFASVGLRFGFIHLRDREAVDRAALNRAAWASHFSQAWSPHFYLFSGDLASGGTLYARMFAPGLGMEEDPATGSAGAALAAALGDRSAQREGDFTWRIDQGFRMGRPSRIEAVARKKDGKLVSVEVGGPSVIVGEGFMTASTGRAE